ncbi:hypothetical protein SEVIR_3G226000v4 [Setaria viridis]
MAPIPVNSLVGRGHGAKAQNTCSSSSPLRITEIPKPGRSVDAFKCRHRCWPEQDATRRTTNCFPRAAACNDHFTCPIFLLLLCSRLPSPLQSLGPSPEAADAGRRVDMEAKKKSAASAAAAAGAGAAPPPANGYFSAVFSSSPAGNAKDAKQTDLYAMLNKQSSRGQNGSSITDSKSHGRTTYKDGKHAYPNESSESPYFGSSVHYGGREFYSSSQQKQPANEPPRNVCSYFYIIVQIA